MSVRYKHATPGKWKTAGEYNADNTDEQGPLPVTNVNATGGAGEVQGSVASGDAASGAKPVLVGGRYDSTAPTAVDDGDLAALFIDAEGRLYVKAQGMAASGAAASGNPNLMGGRYDSTDPTSVDDGDVVELRTDATGRLRVINDGALNPADDQVGCAPFSVPIEGAHTQDTSIDSVTTITPTGDYLVIQVTSAGKNARITFDGTNPTTSLGFVLVAQDPPVRIPTAGKTFKIIAETAGAVAEWQNEEYV